MTNAELIPLFSIPLFKTRIESHSISTDILESLEYRNYSDGTGQQSISTKILLSKPFNDLRNEIEKHLSTYVFGMLKIGQGQLAHVQSWINKHSPGDYAPKHHHVNSCYSGVYYLHVPTGSGSIIFSKSPSNMEQILAHPTEGNLWNSSVWDFPVRSGDLIIFPSHLTHAVPVNKSDDTRYSVAFNYFLEGVLGDNTGQINLRIQS